MLLHAEHQQPAVLVNLSPAAGTCGMNNTALHKHMCFVCCVVRRIFLCMWLCQLLLPASTPVGLMPWVNSTTLNTCVCGQQTLFELQQQFSRTFKDALAACVALAVLLLSGEQR